MRNKPLFFLYTLTPATFIFKQPNEAPAESKPPEESPYSVAKVKRSQQQLYPQYTFQTVGEARGGMALPIRQV